VKAEADFTALVAYVRRGAWLWPIPIVIALTNVLLDPTRLIRWTSWSSRYEERVASAFLAGTSVIDPFGFDHRVVIKSIVTRTTRAPDVLVLGSSKLWPLHREQFAGMTMQNAAVASASMQDLLGLYELYIRSFPNRPKVLVLGIEPWMFNASSGIERWRVLDADYRAARARFGLTALPLPPRNLGTTLEPLTLLFSPDYFQRSLKTAFAQRSISGVPELARGPVGEASQWSPDGGIYFGGAARRGFELEMRPSELGVRAGLGLGHFTALSATATEELRALIADARSQGIAVIVVLAPYAPRAYRYLQRTPAGRMIDESEALVRRVAIDANVPLIGTNDPFALGVTDADFVDALHMLGESLDRTLGARKIFETLALPYPPR